MNLFAMLLAIASLTGFYWCCRWYVGIVKAEQREWEEEEADEVS